MNKKFSTLAAGLMLASAFTVNAQVKEGDYVRFSNSTNKFIGVEIATSGMPTGKLTNATAPDFSTPGTDVAAEQKKSKKQILRFGKWLR